MNMNLLAGKQENFISQKCINGEKLTSLSCNALNISVILMQKN